MAELIITYRNLGMLQTNVFFLINKDTMETIFVDPADNAPYIAEQCRLRGYKPAAILLTHGHFDHIYGVNELRKLTGVKVYAYCDEEKLLMDSEMNRSKKWSEPITVKPDVLLMNDEILNLAGFEIKVIHTPGHTKGSCCYYFEDHSVLISGDTLFKDSYGRTDLDTGSRTAIVRSIKEKLFTLPDEVQVFPGHGEFTEIAYEKKHNPILCE